MALPCPIHDLDYSQGHTIRLEEAACPAEQKNVVPEQVDAGAEAERCQILCAASKCSLEMRADHVCASLHMPHSSPHHLSPSTDP